MQNTSYHLITPFIPVLLMLTIIVANHVVAGLRSDRRKPRKHRDFPWPCPRSCAPCSIFIN